MRIGPFSRRRIPMEPDPVESAVNASDRFTPIQLRGYPATRSVIDKIFAQRHIGQKFELSSGRRLGVIVPFRDREAHLQQLLPALKERLSQQQLEYKIAVVEQEGGKPFNPGCIRNVGAHLLSDWADYFCFHDVDNIPVQSDYRCPSQPLRLISAWESTERSFDVFTDYAYYGGVLSMQKEHFQLINGYPNDFWGWGHEDELFFFRALLSGFVPYQDNDGKYVDLSNPASEAAFRAHDVRKGNKRKLVRRMRWGRMMKNGFSSLKYRLLDKVDLDHQITQYTVSI